MRETIAFGSLVEEAEDRVQPIRGTHKPQLRKFRKNNPTRKFKRKNTREWFA